MKFRALSLSLNTPEHSAHSAAATMSFIETKLLKLPEFTGIYRFFIVEELIFVETPLHFHHGRCAVIGRIAFDDGDYYLENIRLNALNKKYRIPTGTLRILLLLEGGFRERDINSFVEVNGETVFWRKNEDTTNPSRIIQKSTIDLARAIRSDLVHLKDETDESDEFYDKQISMEECTFDEDEIKEYLKNFSEKYVHAIKVDSINTIESAEEVVYCNLQIRKLLQRMDGK